MVLTSEEAKAEGELHRPSGRSAPSKGPLPMKPHERALAAADDAYANAQASEGIEWLTSEQQHMRGLDAAISAYFFALAQDRPSSDALKLVIEYDSLLRHWEGEHQVLLEGDVAEIDAAYDKMIAAVKLALHTPIEAGNGDGWNDDMSKAPRDGTMLWLGHECGFMEPSYFKSAGNGFWVNRYTQLPIQWTPRFWQHIPLPPSVSSSDGRGG